MSLLTIKEHYHLSWNPDKSGVADIFADPIARVIWCGFKQQHAVDQFFNDDVRALAGKIRGRKSVDLDELVVMLMAHLFGALPFGACKREATEFAQMLLPFIQGNKLCTYGHDH